MQAARRITPLAGRRLPVLASWLAVASVGCYGTADPIRAVLDQRLAQAAIIYHLGCNTLELCPDPHRMCGTGVLAAMRADLAAGEEEIAVEWEEQAGDRGFGPFVYYWLVQPDGGGESFAYEWAGLTRPSCGGEVGWCRVPHGPGELYDPATGEFFLRPYGGSALSNPEECDWP